MQGNDAVIGKLEELLALEWGAVHQYAAHEAAQENWGYERLTKHVSERGADERGHAKKLLDRLVFLGAQPDAARVAAVNAVWGSVPAQLAADLASEVTAVLAYRDAIDACNLANDHGSRMLLEGILADEEEHVNELEAELAQVQQAGVGPYLAAQIETKG